MPLLPIRVPRFGLAFSSRAVTLVERGGRGRGARRPRIRRIQESRLPPGLILPSDNAANVMDPTALTELIRDVLAPLRGQPVALSLPDQATQMALLEFETLPRNSSECEALIRWRLREELALPRADTHLAYHVFGDRRHTPPSESKPVAQTRVLAVSIQRGVLAQYEQACEGLGLLPLSIGISSLDLFDLCRALMPRRREVYFAHCSADGWTFLAVHDGIPALVRLKNTRGARIDLATELLGTLQYYEDLVNEAALPAEPTDQCVWLVDTMGVAPEEAGASSAPPEPPLPGALRLGFRSIQVHHLGWETFANHKARAQEFPVSGLPALAGMVAA